MADLENNLESIEEVKQPHDGAEKGDSKPVKQGSSDAAEIGSGKVEVVKPEENPVDKAVASVKKAETAPSNEGDAQKKNAGKSEKADSIKEDEEESKKDEVKSSKMESIKAIVNNMKEMTKEDIQSILGTISEEEVDESLTKAEVARKVVESLKSMTEEEVYRNLW
jgi:dGTP triphosphohydrolase